MMGHDGATALHEKQEKEKMVAISETIDGYRLKLNLAERHRDRESSPAPTWFSVCHLPNHAEHMGKATLPPQH